MAFGPDHTFTEQLTVKVTSKDQEAKKNELVDVDRRLREIAEQKAADMADYNQRLKDARASQKALLDTIENGTAVIEVECYWRLNDKLQQVELVRTDTGKIIPERTRPLTQEERQLSIEDLDPKGEAKPKATKPTKPKGTAKAKGGKKNAGSEATA